MSLSLFFSYVMAYLIVAGLGLAILLSVVRAIWSIVKRIELAFRGEAGVARVVDLWQTGAIINQMPQMCIVLDVQPRVSEPYRITITQVVDLGRMPRIGDVVPVRVDPNHPHFIILR